MKIVKRSIVIVAVIALGAIAFLTVRNWLLPHGITEKIIASGKFHQVAHFGEGTATIYKLLSGERVLQLTDFKTGAGQDLEVYLISAPDAFENETVEKSETLSLGALQHIEGDQAYKLPGDADLKKCKAVTIWSTRYRVNFTTAPLKALSQEFVSP